MQDISGSGIKVTIIAVPTFPQGLTVTEFASDSDPVNSDSQNIAEQEMGVNGDMVVYGTPKAIPISLSVIPNSESDRNLGILLDMNRVAKNKVSTKDLITMVISYPSGEEKTFINGRIMGGPITSSVASNSRIKSKQYDFAFENKLN